MKKPQFKFKVLLSHDNGKALIHVIAESEQEAKDKICRAEGCPPGAISKIRNLGPI